MDGTGKPMKSRLMIKAELNGQHLFETSNGVKLNIVQRGGQYLVRGRINRQAFAVTLGSDPVAAFDKLCEIKVEISNGRFQRHSERKRQPLNTLPPEKLMLVDLVARYLADRRRARGEDTAGDYRSRLIHLLTFADLPSRRKRWPYASDIDREFALEYKGFLHQRTTTRNGKPGGKFKPLSERQIFNCLETARMLLDWGMKPANRLLPYRFINPFDNDVVGSKPKKDPLRKQKLPLDFRISIVERLDCWQLATIGLMMILPLRPEELEGILIGDIDFRDRTICIRERLDGADFGKTHQSVYYPFPEKLDPILANCVGDRQEGPLLQRRAVYEYAEFAPGVADCEHLEEEVRDAVLAAGSKAITAQDRKKVVRKYFRSIGGLDSDSLAREFKSVIATMGVTARLYDLRHDVTSDMRRCGIRDLELRYLTSHTTNDILNEYDGLEPTAEMNKWFNRAGGLIDAVRARAESLECVDYRDPLEPVTVEEQNLDDLDKEQAELA